MALKQLLDGCEKYSIATEIKYYTSNATKTVCMHIRPNHMHHTGPDKQYLYGHELCWVDEYEYLRCYITSDFIGDRDLKFKLTTIHNRVNMIACVFLRFRDVKFSTVCSVDVKNQLFRQYILVVCTIAYNGCIISPLHLI